MVSLNTFASGHLAVINVYKSPACGCCSEWVKHLEENGFTAIIHDVQNMNPYKVQANLPYGMASCHTAFVGDYAIEGHVPATDMRRLLTEKPEIRGIAVPGMPIGSPGMEYGARKDAYQTISYTQEGKIAVFANH